MANYAVNRGWGNPPAPSSKIKTVTLSNGVKLPVHESIAELVKHLGEETMRRGYILRPGECWGYAPRRIRGLEKRTDVGSWSNHAYGLAVDINAPSNPLTNNGKVITDMPSWLPELWKSMGFGWGGDYKGKRKDAMHMEFMGTPADAAKYTAQIGKQPETNVPPAKGRTIRIGMTGPDVKTWQTILIGAGELPAGTADGVFGPNTQAATKRFQAKLGVDPDGVAGPATAKATDDLLKWLAGGGGQ